MLVLTRKPGQSILIGASITVTVQHIRGNQVTISVEAPLALPIDREEVRRSKDFGQS